MQQVTEKRYNDIIDINQKKKLNGIGKKKLMLFKKN